MDYLLWKFVTIRSTIRYRRL